MRVDLLRLLDGRRSTVKGVADEDTTRAVDGVVGRTVRGPRVRLR
jgi:hypothetical protein